MKPTIIFAMLSLILVFAAGAFTQVPVQRLRVTFSEAVDTSGRLTATISYDGLELNGNLQIAELTSVAIDPTQCFAISDFSAAHVLGPDRGSLSYDPVNGAYKIKWIMPKNDRVPCRVLLVRDGDGDINAADFAVFRNNFGSTGLRETAEAKDEAVILRSLPSAPTYSFVIDPRSVGR